MKTCTYNLLEYGDEIVAMSMGKILKTYLVDDSLTSAHAEDGTIITFDSSIPFGTNKVKVSIPDEKLIHIGNSVEYVVVTESMKERMNKDVIFNDISSITSRFLESLNKRKYDFTVDELKNVYVDLAYCIGKHITSY